MDTAPKWRFLGYHLIEASLACPDDRDLASFSLKSDRYEQHDHSFSFDLTLSFKGKKTAGSFSYNCVYSVNEEIVVDPDSDQFQMMISNMSAIVLPYIRQTVMGLTNDSYIPIFLPTVDVRFLDPVGGSGFTRRRKNQKGKTNEK